MRERPYDRFYYGRGRNSDKVIDQPPSEYTPPNDVMAAWCLDGYLYLSFERIVYNCNIAEGTVTATDFPDGRAVLAIRQLITFLLGELSIKVYWRV